MYVAAPLRAILRLTRMAFFKHVITMFVGDASRFALDEHQAVRRPHLYCVAQ
jgi:hypothetical protein